MKKYIIFGTGEVGKKAVRFFGQDKVVRICSNHKHPESFQIDGIPLITPDELYQYKDENTTIIIATSKPQFILEIAMQLRDMGLDYQFYEDAAKSEIAVDQKRYESMNRRTSFQPQSEWNYYCPFDKGDNAGDTGSYFWQDLWAARYIIAEKPSVHYDIGSQLAGFIAHLLSAGQKVCMIDIRPLKTKIPGLSFYQADATRLENIEDNSIESISALCSLEHFGLGRYGDPINPEACFTCFDALQHKLKPGGKLYISVPIGVEHVEFNAHRVFNAQNIVKAFSQLKLLEFSTCYREEFLQNVDIHRYDDWAVKGGERFGLFLFQKIL